MSKTTWNCVLHTQPTARLTLGHGNLLTQIRQWMGTWDYFKPSFRYLSFRYLPIQSKMPIHIWSYLYITKRATSLVCKLAFGVFAAYPYLFSIDNAELICPLMQRLFRTVVTKLFWPKITNSALVTGKIYLLRRWEKKTVQTVLTT